MDTNIIGICGLYCGTCPSYLAPRKGDEGQLREWAGSMGLSVDDARCDGCLSDHVAQPCKLCAHGFRECASEHDVTWCYECGDFPCERLYRFRDAHVVDGVSHHASIIDDQIFIREHGLARWVEMQEARATCPNCGATNYWFKRDCAKCGAKLR